MRNLHWFLALWVAWLASTTALAQSNARTEELARAHFKLGSAHYDNGEFLRAAEAFQKAYDISKRPRLLYNIYLAYRDANDPGKAADALTRYLDQVEEAPNRVLLEAKLRALQRGLAEEEAEAEAGAPSTGGETGEAESAPVSEAGAGEPGPADPAQGDAATASAGANLEVSTAPPSLAGSEAGSGGSGIDVLPIALMAGGGALIAGAVVTGLMAASDQSALEDGCSADRLCDPGLESTRSRGKTLATVTDVLWIAGVASAGTGLVLLLLGNDEERADAAGTPTASFGCAPTGCGGSMRMKF